MRTNCETPLRYCAPQIECITVQTEQGIAISGQAGDYQEGGDMTQTSSYIQY